MEAQVTMDTICVPSEDIVAREIEEEIVIVPLVAGIGSADDELYTLNQQGQAIWRHLDGRKSLREMSAALADEFEARPGVIEADILGFATELVRRRILVANP